MYLPFRFLVYAPSAVHACVQAWLTLGRDYTPDHLTLHGPSSARTTQHSLGLIVSSSHTSYFSISSCLGAPDSIPSSLLSGNELVSHFTEKERQRGRNLLKFLPLLAIPKRIHSQASPDLTHLRNKRPLLCASALSCFHPPGLPHTSPSCIIISLTLFLPSSLQTSRHLPVNKNLPSFLCLLWPIPALPSSLAALQKP